MTFDSISINSLPPLPAELEIPMPGDSEPVFREPWEARAFAMAVQLSARGVFTWSEWANRFSQQIREYEAQGGQVDTNNYYLLWQDTLEALVREKTPDAAI